MSNHPRTKDTQAVPSRQAKAKNSLKSKLSFYSINGRSPEEQFAGYVTSVYPTTPVETRKRFVQVLLYAYKQGKRIPTPNEMNQLFEGEYDVPSDIPLNDRQDA